jgi:hypothetical protein
MVDLESLLNSFLVKRNTRLDLPTPESPSRTILKLYVEDVVLILC